MERIIVMDDDRNISDLVHYCLSTIGMDVATYADGERGLEAIVDDPPDLAIVDLMMPKMNGLEVTRAIRANPEIQDLPVVIFTALDRPEHREAVHQAGTEHYVTKPFSVMALAAYVEKILGLRTCAVCGKQRTADDVDYAPEQELLPPAEVGWTVTVDGETCGSCRPSIGLEHPA